MTVRVQDLIKVGAPEVVEQAVADLLGECERVLKGIAAELAKSPCAWAREGLLGV